MFLDRFGFCELDYWFSNNKIYPFTSSKSQNKAKLEEKRRNETKNEMKNQNKQMQNCANDCRRQDAIARTRTYLSVYLLLHFCCHRRVFQSRVHSFQFWFFSGLFKLSFAIWAQYFHCATPILFTRVLYNVHATRLYFIFL